MAELNFDTGLVTYSLNGKVEVTFNPTDSTFVKRLYSVFDALDKKQDEHKKLLDEAKTTEEVFEVSDKLNKEMREMIDGVFNVPVCDALFGDMDVYAMAGGLPVWSNLMLLVMDTVNDSFTAETKATDSKIQAITAKYRK